MQPREWLPGTARVEPETQWVKHVDDQGRGRWEKIEVDTLRGIAADDMDAAVTTAAEAMETMDMPDGSDEEVDTMATRASLSADDRMLQFSKRTSSKSLARSPRGKLPELQPVSPRRRGFAMRMFSVRRTPSDLARTPEGALVTEDDLKTIDSKLWKVDELKKLVLQVAKMAVDAKIKAMRELRDNFDEMLRDMTDRTRKRRKKKLEEVMGDLLHENFWGPLDNKGGAPETKSYQIILDKEAKGFPRTLNELLQINELSEAVDDIISRMRNEFESSGSEDERKRNLFLFDYLLKEKAGSCPQEWANGIMDEGQEPLTLDDFLKKPESEGARLTKPEVLGLRIYTTAAFKSLNNELRKLTEQYISRREIAPADRLTEFATFFPYPVCYPNSVIRAVFCWPMDDHLWAQVTLKQIDSGLRKLAKTYGHVEKRLKLYRGIRGVEFDQYFERAMKGFNGIPPETRELGVLSVSRDFEMAVRASHHL